MSQTLLQSTMEYYQCSLSEAEQFLSAPCTNAFLFDNGIVHIPNHPIWDERTARHKTSQNSKILE